MVQDLFDTKNMIGLFYVLKLNIYDGNKHTQDTHKNRTFFSLFTLFKTCARTPQSGKLKNW